MSGAWLQRRNDLNNLTKTLTETHGPLMRRCLVAKDAEFVVAKWLSIRGFDLNIGGLHLAPTWQEQKKYRDKGDINIVGRGVCEVKGTSKVFTSHSDWPFKDAFIDTKAKVQEKISNTWAWVTVSQDMRYGAFVLASTFDQWSLNPSRYTTQYGKSESVYSAPLSIVTFRDLTAIPENLESICNA